MLLCIFSYFTGGYLFFFLLLLQIHSLLFHKDCPSAASEESALQVKCQVNGRLNRTPVFCWKKWNVTFVTRVQSQRERFTLRQSRCDN